MKNELDVGEPPPPPLDGSRAAQERERPRATRKRASSEEEIISWTRRVVVLVAVLGTIAFCAGSLWILIWSIYNESFWIDIVQRQVPAVVGLPLAAIASLCLVVLLESTSGRVELEVIGFKLKGAAGPAILWVICFLAMAVAIRANWLR